MAGSSRKEENTMPVEIAIKRELTYRRRKVSASHLHQNTNSSRKILPLQAKSTSQVCKPMPLTGPDPNPRPLSACPSGTKRKEPTSNFHGNPSHKAKADTIIHCNISMYLARVRSISSNI